LLELEVVIFWWLKFAIFAIKKKTSSNQVNILEDFLKNPHIFRGRREL
jgi:hypothetical protein